MASQHGQRPDLEGKVVMITGGLCFAFLSLPTCLPDEGGSYLWYRRGDLVSYNPAHVFMLSRNVDQGAIIIEKIQVASPNMLISFIPCDLSSFASIRKAVSDFAQLSPRFDLLICNSAICAVSPSLTADGYDMQFGVNHLGHALLIKLLLPMFLTTALQPSDDVRIVLVTSYTSS
jgi:NAD(P)-dependent dehydrogenase (short-subunit alcohol dehydrogenase family)